ncbi:hypothetical protein [Geothrix sp. 21YS21S-4]|uniref:hypothetical protein n=1 Tax=Geothrix sp. 21YS21S-4 TaxID=3068889 RepID=UPI0027B8F7F3|nr:hypothetical protein [Geothrix sp. 21YS21S-4]
MNTAPEGFPTGSPIPPGIDPELWAAWARAGFPQLPPKGWPPPAPPAPAPWQAGPWGPAPWPPYPPPGYFPPPPPPMAAPAAPKGGLGALFGGDDGGLLKSLAPWFDFSDKDFLKGALLGAAALYVLTNEGTEDKLIRGAAKAAGKVKAKVKKARAAFREAAGDEDPFGSEEGVSHVPSE